MRDMKVIPSMDTTDEKHARDAAYCGDCYMCRHHFPCEGFCFKSGRGLTYPIKGCYAKDNDR